MAKKPDLKDINKLMEGMDGMNFGGMGDKIKESLSGIQPMLEKFSRMSEEQEILRQPKASKNVDINGINCILTLTKDNKVYVQLPTTESSEEYYNEWVDSIQISDKICELTSNVFDLKNELKQSEKLYSNASKELFKIKSSKWFKFVSFFKQK